MSNLADRKMSTNPVCCSCENCIEIVAYNSLYNQYEVGYFCMLDVDPCEAMAIKCEVDMKGFFPEVENFSSRLSRVMGISEVESVDDSPRIVRPETCCNFYKEGDMQDRCFEQMDKEE